VPLTFHEQGVDDFILEHFGVDAPAPELSAWQEPIERAGRSSRTVRIALVGKYVQLEDAYLSVSEALRHAASLQDGRVEIDWIDSEQLEQTGARSEGEDSKDDNAEESAIDRLAGADGILIPGGFGGRGIEGKIAAARVAREQGIPYLGICLGMQIAVAEFARHIAGMEGANSTEFDLETPFPVIDLLPEQKEVADLGGTMRLGADPIKLHAGTRARETYGEAVIYERHRHRYEVNNLLRKRLQSAGLTICGTSPDERLVEVIELDEHPFFVACQFHPEFKSRPERPAPLFRDFIAAALERAGTRGDVEATREDASAALADRS
jgi:CTP synthase